MVGRQAGRQAGRQVMSKRNRLDAKWNEKRERKIWFFFVVFFSDEESCHFFLTYLG